MVTLLFEPSDRFSRGSASRRELLGEAVDRRVGGKNPSGMFDGWNDADKAMQYWAKRLVYVLCRERGSGGCVEP